MNSPERRESVHEWIKHPVRTAFVPPTTYPRSFGDGETFGLDRSAEHRSVGCPIPLRAVVVR
jgi:hypothetical protein